MRVHKRLVVLGVVGVLPFPLVRHTTVLTKDLLLEQEKEAQVVSHASTQQQQIFYHRNQHHHVQQPVLERCPLVIRSEEQKFLDIDRRGTAEEALLGGHRRRWCPQTTGQVFSKRLRVCL